MDTMFSRTRWCAVVLMILFAVALHAQSGTQIPIGSLKAATGAVQLTIVLANGQVVVADVGSGLVLDVSGAKPVLRVAPTAPASTNVVGEVPVTKTDPLVFDLARAPKTGTLALYRNGVRQRLGLDYTLAGTTITFIPHYAGDSNPVLVADYTY